MRDHNLRSRSALNRLRTPPVSDDNEVGPDFSTFGLSYSENAKPDVLGELFRNQYGSLLRFCRIRIKNDADAEDVVQSAFLAARRAYPDKGAEELRPLLFTLVRNLSFNRLKVLSRQRGRLQDISELGERLVCDQSATPEKWVMDAQLLGIAEAVIAGMPARRREALRLHRFEGLTYNEIAKRLSVSATTAKSDVAEAVAELAESFARADRRTVGPAE